MFSHGQQAQEVSGNFDCNSQVPSMFDSQSSQEFHSQSHVKLMSSRELPSSTFSGNEYWSQSSSQDQEHWRSYAKKPLLFQSKQQQHQQSKFYQKMNSSHFPGIMQQKAVEHQQRLLFESIEKILCKQSFEIKENFHSVKTDVIAEFKANLNNCFSNDKAKGLEKIFSSIKDIKQELDVIEKLKESLSEKNSELKVKEETIINLQKTVDELRATIESIRSEDNLNKNVIEKKLNQVLSKNDQLSSNVETLLELSKEGRANTLNMIENSNYLTQQSKLILEKENMVFDEVKKYNLEKSSSNSYNMQKQQQQQYQSPCYLSPVIFQPRFGVQVRSSPTAIVAPFSRSTTSSLHSQNDKCVKSEIPSPVKVATDENKFDDLFEVSSDSSCEEMHDVVDQLLLREKKVTGFSNKNNTRKQKVAKKTPPTVPFQSSTPTNKQSTPVQRSIRRYGKIKKSVNSFSPVHKLSTSITSPRKMLNQKHMLNKSAPPLIESNIQSNRGSLAKRRKLENLFNFDSFDGDEDLRQFASALRRKNQKKFQL